MDTPMGSSGFGTTSASDTGLSSSSGTSASTGAGTCPSCGHSMQNSGLEQFLGKLGISEDMINNLRSSMQNIDVDEYLNTARDYLRTSGEKAKTYTKENPGKIAAGVAVLAIGAGLLISTMNRD